MPGEQFDPSTSPGSTPSNGGYGGPARRGRDDDTSADRARSAGEIREPRDPRDSRDIRESRDRRAGRDGRESRDVREGRDGPVGERGDTRRQRGGDEAGSGIRGPVGRRRGRSADADDEDYEDDGERSPDRSSDRTAATGDLVPVESSAGLPGVSRTGMRLPGSASGSGAGGAGRYGIAGIGPAESSGRGAPSGGGGNGGDAASGPRLPGRMRRTLRGRWVPAIASALVAGATAALFAWDAGVPLFRAEGTLRISPVVPRSAYGEGGAGFDAFVETQVSLVRSGPVLRRAAEDARLARAGWHADAGIRQEELRDAVEVARRTRSELVTVAVVSAEPRRTAPAVNAVLASFVAVHGGNETAARRLRELIDDSDAKGRAAQDLRSELRKLGARWGTDDLKARRVQEEAALRRRETAVADAGAALRTADDARLMADKLLALSVEQIGAQDEVLAGLLKERQDLEMQAPKPGEESRTLAALEARDADMIRHRNERNEAKTRLDELRVDFGPLNPKVKEAEARLAGCDEKIARRSGELKTLVEQAGRRLEETRGKITRRADEWRGTIPLQVRAKVGVPPPTVEERKALAASLADRKAEREASSADLRQLDTDIVLMLDLQERSKLASDAAVEAKARLDTAVRDSAAVARIEVLTEAAPPDGPWSDPRPAYAATAGAGGAAAGFLLVVLLGLMDRRLRYADDLAAAARPLAVLAVVPEAPDTGSRLADPGRTAAAEAAIHRLRTVLEHSPQTADQKVFAFVGPATHDGRTTLSLALGASFAAGGLRTLAIDLDPEEAGLSARIARPARPKLGRLLVRSGRVTARDVEVCLREARDEGRRLGEQLIYDGLVMADEVADYLAEQRRRVMTLRDVLDGEPVEDCAAETDVPGLFVLPAGEPGPVPPAMLRSIVEDAAAAFDVVILDTPPLADLHRVIPAAKAADVVLPVFARGCLRDVAGSGLQTLALHGIVPAGVVFNRAREPGLPEIEAAARTRGRRRSGVRGEGRPSAGSSAWGQRNGGLLHIGRRPGAELPALPMRDAGVSGAAAMSALSGVRALPGAVPGNLPGTQSGKQRALPSLPSASSGPVRAADGVADGRAGGSGSGKGVTTGASPRGGPAGWTGSDKGKAGGSGSRDVVEVLDDAEDGPGDSAPVEADSDEAVELEPAEPRATAGSAAGNPSAKPGRSGGASTASPVDFPEETGLESAGRIESVESAGRTSSSSPPSSSSSMAGAAGLPPGIAALLSSAETAVPLRSAPVPAPSSVQPTVAIPLTPSGRSAVPQMPTHALPTPAPSIKPPAGQAGGRLPTSGDSSVDVSLLQLERSGRAATAGAAGSVTASGAGPRSSGKPAVPVGAPAGPATPPAPPVGSPVSPAPKSAAKPAVTLTASTASTAAAAAPGGPSSKARPAVPAPSASPPAAPKSAAKPAVPSPQVAPSSHASAAASKPAPAKPPVASEPLRLSEDGSASVLLEPDEADAVKAELLSDPRAPAAFARQASRSASPGPLPVPPAAPRRASPPTPPAGPSVATPKPGPAASPSGGRPPPADVVVIEEAVIEEAASEESVVMAEDEPALEVEPDAPDVGFAEPAKAIASRPKRRVQPAPALLAPGNSGIMPAMGGKSGIVPAASARSGISPSLSSGSAVAPVPVVAGPSPEPSAPSRPAAASASVVAQPVVPGHQVLPKSGKLPAPAPAAAPAPATVPAVPPVPPSARPATLAPAAGPAPAATAKAPAAVAAVVTPGAAPARSAVAPPSPSPSPAPKPGPGLAAPPAVAAHPALPRPRPMITEDEVLFVVGAPPKPAAGANPAVPNGSASGRLPAAAASPPVPASTGPRNGPPSPAVSPQTGPRKPASPAMITEEEVLFVLSRDDRPKVDPPKGGSGKSPAGPA